MPAKTRYHVAMETNWPKPWLPSSWNHYSLQQMPQYPDPTALHFTMQHLSRRPPLVPISEIHNLRLKLALLHACGGFFIQAGDCAETFGTCSRYYTAQRFLVFNTIFQEVQKYFKGPLLLAGRLAGQFAKPRSEMFEIIEGEKFTSYHGDIINGLELEDRMPDPKRMLTGYDKTQEVLDDIRRLTLNRNQPESKDLILGENFFTAHEAYLLPYEQALCRQDSLGNWYNTSAHCLWVGERTRQIDGAHIEFLRGLTNCIGVKIGPNATPDELLALSRTLNPDVQLGRLLFIVRMGESHIQKSLPPLISALKNEPILWLCDPMHGNTQRLRSGIKTRHFSKICKELELFFKIFKEYDERPFGLHCEMTPLNVTECIDPERDITEESLHKHYTSACDPRLNRQQAVDLFRLCADLLTN